MDPCPKLASDSERRAGIEGEDRTAQYRERDPRRNLRDPSDAVTPGLTHVVAGSEAREARPIVRLSAPAGPDRRVPHVEDGSAEVEEPARERLGVADPHGSLRPLDADRGFP